MGSRTNSSAAKRCNGCFSGMAAVLLIKAKQTISTRLPRKRSLVRRFLFPFFYIGLHRLDQSIHVPNSILITHTYIQMLSNALRTKLCASTAFSKSSCRASTRANRASTWLALARASTPSPTSAPGRGSKAMLSPALPMKM